MNEFDKFYAKIWAQGDSLVITIPANLVRFAGFDEGQEVTVMIKKKTE